MSDVGESYSSYNMLSFFGRVNYEYGRKYAFDLTLRNDASSRFGKDNRNALFYAIGGMWNIKEENFLKDNRVLTDLKLRVTYGTQGNSSISNYASLRLVSTGANYGDVSGKYFASTGNNYLGWEKQGLFNVSSNSVCSTGCRFRQPTTTAVPATCCTTYLILRRRVSPPEAKTPSR